MQKIIKSNNNCDHQENCLILCNTPEIMSAEIISNYLLEKKLASCVTLIPKSVSLYFWEEKIKKKSEIQLLIKSKKELSKKIFKKISKMHPYQIPEILVLPIIDGEKKYLNWMNSLLK